MTAHHRRDPLRTRLRTADALSSHAAIRPAVRADVDRDPRSFRRCRATGCARPRAADPASRRSPLSPGPPSRRGRMTESRPQSGTGSHASVVSPPVDPARRRNRPPGVLSSPMTDRAASRDAPRIDDAPKLSPAAIGGRLAQGADGCRSWPRPGVDGRTTTHGAGRSDRGRMGRLARTCGAVSEEAG